MLAYLVPLAILLGFLAVAGALVWSRKQTGQAPDTLQRDPDLWARVAALQSDLTSLSLVVGGLPGLWKEEADRAERAAERERKAAERKAAARARPNARGEEGEPERDDPAPDVHGSTDSRVLPMPTRVAADGGGEQEAYLSQVRRALALGDPRHP